MENTYFEKPRSSAWDTTDLPLDIKYFCSEPCRGREGGSERKGEGVREEGKEGGRAGMGERKVKIGSWGGSGCVGVCTSDIYAPFPSLP